MARGDAQLNLRLPADLKGKIELLASKNRRSQTAEVIVLLESAIKALNDAGKN